MRCLVRTRDDQDVLVELASTDGNETLLANLKKAYAAVRPELKRSLASF